MVCALISCDDVSLSRLGRFNIAEACAGFSFGVKSFITRITQVDAACLVSSVDEHGRPLAIHYHGSKEDH